MKLFIFIIALFCIMFCASAQIHISPVVGGNVNKPIFITSYEVFTSNHIPLQETHPAYPKWEVWMSYDGIVYVVLRRKQSWLNRKFTYKKFSATILNVGTR